MIFITNGRDVHAYQTEVDAEGSGLMKGGWYAVLQSEAMEICAKNAPKMDRKKEVLHALALIDADSARPARAVAVALAAGKAPEAFDVSKLQSLDAKADALRAELKTL